MNNKMNDKSKSPPIEISKILTISDYHFPEKDLDIIRNYRRDDTGLLVHDCYPYYYWNLAHIVEQFEHFSSTTVEILKWTIKQDIDFIRIDPDCPIYEEFPTFDL